MYGLNRLADMLKRIAYCDVVRPLGRRFLEPDVVVAGLKQQLVRAKTQNTPTRCEATVIV